MRALVIIMDSFGIGSTPDAASFGDEGSNTLGHIAQYRAEKNKPLNLPNLEKLGLGNAYKLVHQRLPQGFDEQKNASINMQGAYAAAKEISSGKDTPSGHWEIMGLPVPFDWGYFENKESCFPQALLDDICKTSNITGYLGNCHASGTQIIAQLGQEHIDSNKPIFYTSNDSVFQIAAHEEHFGLENLYKLCEQVFDIIKPYNICRVIARPFIGNKKDGFTRTGNRRDFAVSPHGKTFLDKLHESKGNVYGIGKISDIYAASGIGEKIKATGHDELWQKTLHTWQNAPDNSLVMSNFVEFDQSFGHRRDIEGYARALEEFDTHIPELLDTIGDDDLLIITADHGCDPSWHGSDHTREYVPILIYANNIQGKAFQEQLVNIDGNASLGIRESFADIGQSLANFFTLDAFEHGTSFIKRLE